jgi:NADH-quinone oxidoreductase subunit F
MTEPDLSFVDRTVEKLGQKPEAVIPVLQALQDHYRYLPPEALRRVCDLTEITPASITGVSTFYTQFRHRPVGRHLISVCHGTACHVKGSGLLQDAIQHQLGISGNGQDTDSDGLFTVQKVACLGCCTLAPVIQIDKETYGRVTPARVPDVLTEFLNRVEDGSIRYRPQKASAKQGVPELRIGMGSCCTAQGAGYVHQAVAQTLAELGAEAEIKRVGCVGMCYQAPLIELVPPEGSPKLMPRVQVEDVRALVMDHFKPKGVVRRIGFAATRLFDRLLTDETPGQTTTIDPGDGTVCAFLGRQKHIATENCSAADPTDLEEYVRLGGFRALKRCRDELSPEEIIEEVKASGLRGRGGAGFPTGVKWGFVRAAEGDRKFLVCNGDEGDPGAFMDRMLLESTPYRIIEGMAIAAKAVGATEGVFYIRAEYPLAIERVGEALQQCKDRGLLGDSAGENGIGIELSIKEGAGAFVCGEETALLASLEGRRGMPRLRPPFPAQSGLNGLPTLINNVETYALLPWIFRNGAQAFAALGTEKSTGTKVFALAGKIRRGGLIEVPMGITIREIVEEIGGGVTEGRRFKAVQVGGPSGGCVPAYLSDTRVDYEALAEVGAIMGSGGLVVLDDADCMVDIARYFLRFTQDQSCGKCTLCRVGTRRMLDILDRICTGGGEPADLAELDHLARAVGAGSICGLGKTAPNPVLSTLKYFRAEYEAHIGGRCPAGKCQDLIHYRINDKCIGCTLCAQHCPVDAIPMTPYAKHTINDELCTRCDTCREVCPTQAVFVD